jgi:H+-transporting ATPase
VRWEIRGILVFASVMGLLSVVETFGLLLIGLRWVIDPQLQDVIAINSAQLQTVMFLQLAVGGHLLLFVVRTKGTLLRPPYPSARLFWAIVATQIVAVVICLMGVGVSAIPAAAIIAVWIYSLAWVVVLDILKLAFLSYVAARERDLVRQRASLAG